MQAGLENRTLGWTLVLLCGLSKMGASLIHTYSFFTSQEVPHPSTVHCLPASTKHPPPPPHPRLEH